MILVSCNQNSELKENTNPVETIKGDWIVYFIINPDKEDTTRNLNLVLGVFILNEVDFDYIKFSDNDNYYVYDTKGNIILSAKYHYEESKNKLILNNEEDGEQSVDIIAFDKNNLELKSPEKVII